MGRVLPTIRSILLPLFFAISAGFVYLLFVRIDYAFPYAIIVGSSFLTFFLLIQANRGGLPFFAALMFQHGLVYGFPLLVENQSIETYDSKLLLPTSFAFLTFVLASVLSWKVIEKIFPYGGPSRFPFFQRQNTKDSDGKVAKLGLLSFYIAILLEYSFFSGFFFSFGGAFAIQFFSVFRLVALATAMIGSFLVSYSLTTFPGFKVMFWIGFSFLLTIIISGVLLSAAVGVILSTMTGLFLGSRRIPWVPMLMILGVIGFLNQGKFEVRSKYWQDGAIRNVSLENLPQFYGEWIQFSWSKINLFSDQIEQGDEGQSLLSRINNLQNLLFIQRSLQLENGTTMNGESYTYIPMLLIPRMLWNDKPRTHEGQIRLNLHFNRQVSIEETERTYIAWGLLPEAMGNFGLWLGPVLIGLLLGGLLGFLESWSRNKTLISIEGVMSLIWMLSTIGSYEMVMSVLVTSLFQISIFVLFVGLFARRVLSW